MNKRVKELRKALGLSGEKFGERVGLKRNSVSQIETGKNGLTEANILSICREYNVNEAWLRTGEGDMFQQLSELGLDELVKKNQVDTIEIDILKAYFSLDKELRNDLISHFKTHLSKD